MATRIFFHGNEILIDTIPTPFVAGSLIATLNGLQVDITRFGSQFVFASPLWSDVADANGTVFSTPDAAMTYLAGQFGMLNGGGSETMYPLTASFGFTAAHGLSYIPDVTMLDVSGVTVEADVVHAPGQTTVMFSTPFTGTLYIG